MEIALLILAAASLSIIVTKSDAFKFLRRNLTIKNRNKYGIKRTIRAYNPLRRFASKVINCPLCFGFYSYFVCYGISVIPILGWHILTALCAAIVSMFIWSKM